MIARIWHGHTTPENANRYAEMLQPELIPGVGAKAGYRGGMLFRRDLGDEVEFTTIMFWDSLEAIIALAGPDYEKAIIPPERRELLTRFDAVSIHCEVVDVQDLRMGK